MVFYSTVESTYNTVLYIMKFCLTYDPSTPTFEDIKSGPQICYQLFEQNRSPQHFMVYWVSRFGLISNGGSLLEIFKVLSEMTPPFVNTA